MSDVEGEEAALVAAARGGDRKAFDTLFDRHEDAVREGVDAYVADERAPIREGARQAAWVGFVHFDPRHWSFATFAAFAAIDAYWGPKARGGDHRALEALWAVYGSAVRGRVRRATKIDIQRDEIIQDARILSWHRMAKFRVGEPFRAFLLFHAKIAIARYFRRHKRGEIFLADVFAEHPEVRQDGEVLALLEGRVDPSHPVAGLSLGASLEHDEEVAIHDEVCAELLGLVVSTSPPHQAVCFLLSKSVVRPTFGDLRACAAPSEAPSVPGPLTNDLSEESAWPPRHIVTHLSDFFLRSLATWVEAGYAKSSGLPDDAIKNAFRPLRDKTWQKVAEVITEPKMRASHARLLGRVVGETVLRDYYTNARAAGQATNIYQWSNSVQRRIWSAAKRRDSGPLFDLFQRNTKDSGGPDRRAGGK